VRNPVYPVSIVTLNRMGLCLGIHYGHFNGSFERRVHEARDHRGLGRDDPPKRYKLG
jgi:hypothetical protein